MVEIDTATLEQRGDLREATYPVVDGVLARVAFVCVARNGDL